MDFGKVGKPTLETIKFKLPVDDPRTREILKRSNSAAPLRFGLGCPVWAVKSWLGNVYPTKTESADYLYHYSRQFNSIELNTTHYRTPDSATIARWKTQTPDGFKFCVKFLQDISHRKPIASHLALTKEFVTQIMGLEDRLGISFLQLPPYFAHSDLDDLKRFLEQLPKDFDIAVEVRHPDFFRDHVLLPRLYDLLASHNAATVITDVAGRQDVLHTSLTANRVIVRFIGNELHPTDESRLAEWSPRLISWFREGLKQVEFFIHQPDDVLAPELSNRFIDRLNSDITGATNLQLGLKKWEMKNQGEQLGWF